MLQFNIFNIYIITNFINFVISFKLSNLITRLYLNLYETETITIYFNLPYSASKQYTILLYLN